MPLKKGNSKETISKNIEELINAGHEPEQAAAIAYKTAQGDMIYFSDKLSDNIEETPEGFLICKNVSLARTGLMEYANVGQLENVTTDTVMIGHSAEGLSNIETIASFEGKSTTIEHPDDMLDPENISSHSVGHIQNVLWNDESQTLTGDLIIITAEAIKLVKNGLREVSCGYWADVIQNDDGTGTLTNVVGNHLALVANGRCGGKCAIKDSEEKMKMTEKETLLNKILSVFKDDDSKKDDSKKMDDEEQFDAKSSFDAISKRLDEFEAKLNPKKDDEEATTGSPDKMGQVLALLQQLLAMEKTEATEENTEMDAKPAMNDSAETEQDVKIEFNDSFINMDGLYKAPTPAELNAKFALKYGGK